MHSRLYHSALDLSQMINAPMCHTNSTRVYTRIWILLKAHRSDLHAIQSRVKSLSDTIPDNSVLTSLSSLISNLLDCLLGRLPETAHEVILQLQGHLRADTLDPEVKTLLLRLLKATLSLTTLLMSLQVHNDDQALPSPEMARPVEDTTHDEEIICRICDQPVSVDLISDHLTSCLAAYQSKSRVLAIDAKLQELAGHMCSRFLNVPWPGEREKCVNIYLPLVHARMLVGRACDVDMSYLDGADDLELISASLEAIWRMPLPCTASEIIKKMENRTREKKHVARAFREAMGVWVKTTKTDPMKQGMMEPLICDFELLSLISSGAFARVFLAKKKTTGDIFAIKVLSKDDVVRKNQVKRVLAEKDILLQFGSPYIIKFYYSIIGERNLYLVMEYVPGGDLFSLLKNLNALEEKTVRTYTYQIVKALEYLHTNGIIHRDLKPDNILVSASGTLKLTDFGLSYLGVVDRRNATSKDNIVESNSLVGTPDYVAPEIVLNMPHSFQVDWWSLGIIVYELVRGLPPFHQDTVANTRRQILTGKYDPLTPEEDDVSPECIDFVSKLLVDNPKLRLGANGPQEVLNHPWLAGIKDIKDVEVPFVPELQNSCDTAYFERRYVPSKSSDADIIGDINAAIEKRNRERGRYVRHGRMRSLSLLSSEDMSDKSLTDEDHNPDSDIMNFPSVSLKQLESKSRKIAKKVRERSKSFISDEPDKPVPRSQVFMHRQQPRRSVDISSRRTIQVVWSEPVCLLQPGTDEEVLGSD